MAAERSDAVYFLLHIPKTAGQTIQYHLAEHGPPGSLWLPRRARLPLPLVGRRHWVSDLGDPRLVRAVAGHECARSLETRFAGREIRRVALLREPLDLQLSLYNYRMMNNLNKGLGTYGFGVHLAAQPRDFAAHWLLSRWLEIPWPHLLAMTEVEKYRVLNRALAGFWFVADYRACDRLIAAMAGDLGVPAVARPRNEARQWRDRIKWEPLTEATLSPALREAVHRQNPLDQALWETWRGAGFATTAVQPAALAASGRTAFLRHEARRPWFLMALAARRRAPAWLPFLWPRRGLRSGIFRADQARDAGQWQLAAGLYRRALAEEPNLPAIWMQYGHVLWVLGDVAAAERAYREAARLAPGDANMLAQVDQALQLAGWQGDAADAYRRAVSLDPGLGGAAVDALTASRTAQSDGQRKSRLGITMSGVS